MTFESVPIPQPPPKWFLGNASDINPSDAASSFVQLAAIYGEIFQLDLPGRKVVVCSSHALVDELCDASRFEKTVAGALKEVRVLTGNGLFTAYPGEHSWGVAHRILMPVFGPMGIRKMFGGMLDIASQMMLCWDRFGPDHEILCSNDFTLTFDMIGLCAFGFRFNNFYSESGHPFVTQMTDVLMEAGRRSGKTSIENRMRIFSAKQTAENVAEMHKLCDEIIADRKAHPQPDSKDLLNPMLESIDPKTGEKMSLESVRFNMVTFLVAGHETTSGTLGFTFYYLCRNPRAYLAAQKEIDEVLGDGPIKVEHIPHLKYVKYCIFEALRLMGPISIITKHALKPTKLAGKYDVDPSTPLIVNLRSFHHDPKVWGDDADIFRPERFLDGGYENLPPNSFKAFGDGERACIGRLFAEQEMIMVVALILQKFQVEMADPSYVLHLKAALTVKPDEFKLKVRRRPGRTMDSLGAAQITTPQQHADKPVSVTQQHGKPLTVLYGSQAGTCKSYAEELESNAGRFGFQATLRTLDSATENVPKDQPVVIISPSYEGKPADNAKKFVTWLETNATNPKLLENISYAVFSVGNSDWTNTFNRVPKLIDSLFEKMGAKRFTTTGFVDVKYDIMGPWEDWSAVMWEDLRKLSGTTSKIEVQDLKATITPPKFATHLGGQDMTYGVVKVNKELGGKEVGLLKKHMEIELPEDVGYRSGDYMVVLPQNHLDTIKRVLRRFALPPDDSITITGTNKAFLSPGTPITLFELLATRVELSTPASQKQIQALVAATLEAKQSDLSRLATDEVFKSEVLPKRYSVLDLLEDNPDCQLGFSNYLDMLKPLTPRQYSISSSPLANVEFIQKENITGQKLTASVTYDVHDEPAWSGHGREFKGVASTYLARQHVGEKVRCFTRPTNVNFHLPLDPTTPIIMIAAGSGLAPMRGFIQERAVIKQARGQNLGPAILYFGCRHYEKDFIYAHELRQWEKEGVVSLRPCFSKVGPAGTQEYVPDKMWEDRDELSTLFKDQGAKIFVCGSASKLAKSTADVCKKIWIEKTGGDEAGADEWLNRVKEERYVSDVFE